MKRFTFKPLALFSAVLSIPAAAQNNPPAKTPLELLAEGKDAAKISMSAKDAELLGIKIKMVDDRIELDLSGTPEACAKQIDLELKAEAVQDWQDKLKKADSLKEDELKSYTTKITPVIGFSGVPAVKTLAECLVKAKDQPKSTSKISKDIANPSEPAYVELGGSVLKNAAYVKLENDVKRINCEDCNDTPEKLLESLKTVDRSNLTGITAKLAEQGLDKLLLDFVTAAEAAKSEADLAIIIKGLDKFSKDVESMPITDASKKNYQTKIYAIRTQGISAKEHELCQAEASKSAWGDLGVTKPAPASSDFLSQFRTSLVVDSAPVQTASVAARCTNFVANAIKGGGSYPRVDASVKKQDLELSRELTKKGSEARTQMIGQIDAKDPEMREALVNASNQMWAAQNQLSTHCGKIQNDAQFTQCGILNDRYNKYGKFLQTYGQRFQAATAQDNVMWNSFSSNYSNSRYNPFASNTLSAIPNTQQSAMQSPQGWNGSNSQMNYNNTAFDPSLMYRPDNNWNRSNGSTDPRAINNTQLPYAIPLRMQMS